MGDLPSVLPHHYRTTLRTSGFNLKDYVCATPTLTTETHIDTAMEVVLLGLIINLINMDISRYSGL